MVLTCLVPVLLASLCGASPLGGGLEVLVHSPVVALAGHSATLPCWLNPPQSAVAFEVQWYRSDRRDLSVLTYKEGEVQRSAANSKLDGRVTFGRREASSGGLASGDVSLELHSVTIGDAGGYTCYVGGDQNYDEANVTLAVTQPGGPVQLLAVWNESSAWNISCESAGWYPEPQLQWRDSRGDILSPKGAPKHSRDSSGLVLVHSWTLVSSSSKVSCSVSLEGRDLKEASVSLEGPTRPAEKPPESLSEPGPSVGGWVAFGLLLVAVLAALGFKVFRANQKKRTGEKPTGEVAEAQQPLLPVSAPTDLKDSRKSHEKVTFAQTVNPCVTVGKDGCLMRDSQEAGSSPEVTCRTANIGAAGFSSGRHYWEVSLRKTPAPVKTSWWLGVIQAKNLPLQADSDPRVSNGFWFLSSSSSSQCLHFNTEPQVSLPVRSRPETVAVFLDCDAGELSFYNVEEDSLIGGLTVPVGPELYPLFNTGLGDPSPMGLVHDETKKEADVNNSCGAAVEQHSSQ